MGGVKPWECLLQEREIGTYPSPRRPATDEGCGRPIGPRGLALVIGPEPVEALVSPGPVAQLVVNECQVQDERRLQRIDGGRLGQRLPGLLEIVYRPVEVGAT